jgi:hypothetical protein
MSLLLARDAFLRLDHLRLISNLKLLLHKVESIVGWICCNNGGAFRRLDHVWLSHALALAVSHLLLAPFLLLALYLFFFPRLCRRRF